MNPASTMEMKKKANEQDSQNAQSDEKKEIPQDYFYPENHLETIIPESSIPQHCFSFQ